MTAACFPMPRGLPMNRSQTSDFRQAARRAAIAVLTAGCVAAAAAAGPSKIVVALEEDPPVINAAVTRAVSSYATSAPVYSALTHIPREGVVEPDLAERWEISPDGRRYTF